MRVLVAGSGGREHALVWKVARSPLVEAVFAAPGSDAMAREATCLADVAAGDSDALAAACREHGIDLVVIGPEDPLADGVADRLREVGLAVFGPSAAAARLEGSKAFAREFMARHDVPRPEFAVFDDLEAARAYARERGACVVKADGLAAGKGVAVCSSADEALAALDEIMGARRFGEAGDRVLIEERLIGEEASYYAISDGERVATLVAAQDFKRALDGDEGENTGGMGAVAPAAVVSPDVEKRVLEEIVHPTLRGMREEGTPFRGVLYVGLIIGDDRAPKVIEFNVRFGDPETQALMLQMQGDIVPLLDGAARGTLAPDALGAQRSVADGERAAVCVVVASGGYPRSYRTGLAIHGLEQAEADPDVVVFHAGTRREGARFVTAGGRVLGVTARGADVATAREKAYAAADRVRFDGAFARRDIALRARDR